jgi:hypothetical protein
MSWTRYTGAPWTTLARHTVVAVFHHVATLIASSGANAATSSS